MKVSTVAALGIVLLPGASASAQPPSQPSDAIVLIRVFATVSAEVDEFRKRVEQSDVQVATGTGFIVSSSGHILTNHHLIAPENKTITIDGRKFEIKTALDRIEVVLQSGQRLDATVFGSDPEMDLAVLAAGAGGLPYLPFGDSDAIEPGASVTAFGYPFGEAVEVGRTTTGVAVPQATVTPGAVSAVRAGDDEEPRFLQVTNALNPGNSGGPIVDAEGYAVGIVAMKATKADGVGFAIAINRAKDFLERVGLDSALPSRRLTLAATASLHDKGLRLRMPHGYQDLVPGRLRAEAGDRSAGDPVLDVDRVFSRWTVDQMEQGVLAGNQVGSGTPYAIDGQSRRATKGQVSGRASMTGVDGRRRTMEYRIISLGTDWIVARYEGTAEVMAFNRSVLKGSLVSIDVDPLLRAEMQPPRWSPGRVEPAGWIAEPGGPLGCEQSAAPPGYVWTSPDHYGYSARYAVWDGAVGSTLIAACHGAKPDGSYRLVGSHAGVSYVSSGQLLRGETGVVQIEFRVPREHETAAVEWLRQWRAALTGK